MPQYREGTVSVAQNSSTVTGIGTSWDQSLVDGAFLITGDSVPYYVASINVPGQTLQLSAAYQGPSVNDIQYSISNDFTTNHSWPVPDAGYVSAAPLIKTALHGVDGKVGTVSADVNALKTDVAALRAGGGGGGAPDDGTYRLETYGAVGDGVTDDSDAIDAALWAVHQAGGGIVRARADKTYLCNDLIGWSSLDARVTFDLNGATLRRLDQKPVFNFYNTSRFAADRNILHFDFRHYHPYNPMNNPSTYYEFDEIEMPEVPPGTQFLTMKNLDDVANLSPGDWVSIISGPSNLRTPIINDTGGMWWAEISRLKAIDGLRVELEFYTVNHHIYVPGLGLTGDPTYTPDTVYGLAKREVGSVQAGFTLRNGTIEDLTTPDYAPGVEYCINGEMSFFTMEDIVVKGQFRHCLNSRGRGNRFRRISGSPSGLDLAAISVDHGTTDCKFEHIDFIVGNGDDNFHLGEMHAMVVVENCTFHREPVSHTPAPIQTSAMNLGIQYHNCRFVNPLNDVIVGVTSPYGHRTTGGAWNCTFVGEMSGRLMFQYSHDNSRRHRNSTLFFQNNIVDCFWDLTKSIPMSANLFVVDNAIITGNMIRVKTIHNDPALNDRINYADSLTRYENPYVYQFSFFDPLDNPPRAIVKDNVGLADMETIRLYPTQGTPSGSATVTTERFQNFAEIPLAPGWDHRMNFIVEGGDLDSYYFVLMQPYFMTKNNGGGQYKIRFWADWYEYDRLTPRSELDTTVRGFWINVDAPPVSDNGKIRTIKPFRMIQNYPNGLLKPTVELRIWREYLENQQGHPNEAPGDLYIAYVDVILMPVRSARLLP